jgi:hypothetical protein
MTRHAKKSKDRRPSTSPELTTRLPTPETALSFYVQASLAMTGRHLVLSIVSSSGA